MVSTLHNAARLPHDFLTHSFVLSSLHFFIVSLLPHTFLAFPLPQLLGVSTPSRLPIPSWLPSQLSHGLFQGLPRGLPHNSLTDFPKDSLITSSQLPHGLRTYLLRPFSLTVYSLLPFPHNILRSLPHNIFIASTLPHILTESSTSQQTHCLLSLTTHNVPIPRPLNNDISIHFKFTHGTHIHS